MNLKRKLITGALALVGTAAAHAGPFYMNTGIDYGLQGATNGKVCATCTKVFNEFTFKYDSSTVISDTVNDNVIGAGDLLTTTAGLAVPGKNWTTNYFTGANPFEASAMNGLNQPNMPMFGLTGGFLISFKLSGLNGVVTGVNGQVPLFAYGPGLLEMFISFDNGATSKNFMDINVTGGGATGVSTILIGTADFTNVDAAYNNLFNAATPTCGGKTGFYDIWLACGPTSESPLQIAFQSTFDTNVTTSSFAPIFGNQANPADVTAFQVGSNHNGSGTFDIPEPGTLALAGLALVGLASARRRKA